MHSRGAKAHLRREAALSRQHTLQPKRALQRGWQCEPNYLHLRVSGAVSHRPTFALLQPHGSPWQVVVHHSPGTLQVEALGSYVRYEEMFWRKAARCALSKPG